MKKRASQKEASPLWSGVEDESKSSTDKAKRRKHAIAGVRVSSKAKGREESLHLSDLKRNVQFSKQVKSIKSSHVQGKKMKLRRTTDYRRSEKSDASSLTFPESEMPGIQVPSMELAEDGHMNVDDDSVPDVTLKVLDNSSSADAEDFSIDYFYGEYESQKTTAKLTHRHVNNTSSREQPSSQKPPRHKLVKF